MKPADLDRVNVGWKCACGEELPLRQRLTKQEMNLWLDRVPIRKQLAILFLFSEGEPVSKIAASKKIHEHSVRFL